MGPRCPNSVCASRAFVYFARIYFYTFSLPLGVKDWLRLLFMALPGLFYYFLSHAFESTINYAIHAV